VHEFNVSLETVNRTTENY